MKGFWIATVCWLCMGHLFAGGHPASPASVSQTREMVLFPLTIESGVQQPEEFNLSVETLNALYAKVKDIPGVYVSRFRPTNPSVARALEENRLRRDRLEPPYNQREADGTWRSARIGAVMGADLVLAGSIAVFRYDPARREAVLTLSVDLVQVSDNTVVVSVVESGRGSITVEENDPNLAYIRAIEDATNRVALALKERLLPPTTPAETPQEREKRKATRRQEGTIFGLFSLLLGIGTRALLGL